MKKNSFLQGTFIATFGIVLSKILGILYVIPFFAMVGTQGGALYGYAYSIYAIFLSISQAGIPLAMSKVTSEYQALGYTNLKEKAFRVGKKTLLVLGVVSFLILFFSAPLLSKLILGNVSGGNTVEDVTFVIRMISTAVLVVPILSVYRGYLQGHNYITPTSVSQVLEQLVRVLVILVGSFLTVSLFHLPLKTTIGISVFAATIGAVISYLYLAHVVKKNQSQLVKENKAIVEPVITNQMILKKILWYAMPFIMIDVFQSLYHSVDLVTLVQTLVGNLGYKATEAEAIMGVFSTWGHKLNMIVVALTTGMMVSLIPHLTRSFVHQDMADVRKKINQTLQSLLFFVIPMVFGLSFLARPIWTVFYGSAAAISYGAVTYQYYVFIALALTLFTSMMTIAQVLKEYKVVFGSLIFGLLIKVLLNVPLLYGFTKMGLPSYYGSITATILGYLLAVVVVLIYLRKKYQISYEDTLQKVMNILGGAILMVLSLFLLQFIIPTTLEGRIINIFVILIYLVVGVVVYLFLMKKKHMIADIFGEENLAKWRKKR